MKTLKFCHIYTTLVETSIHNNAKKYLKKVICVFSQEPYGLLQMLFGIFVRSVEDGLEPSQTYDEVNKLLLTLPKSVNH